MATLYTRSANRTRLAAGAIDKLDRASKTETGTSILAPSPTVRSKTRISEWFQSLSFCIEDGPMLRGMRKASSNWLGKTIMAGVMGVLIISFGIWGIADIFRGFGQSTLATIGRTEISTDSFRQLYTEKLQQIGRQFGRPLSPD